MSFVNSTHTRNVIISNNAAIGGIQFKVTNGKDDKMSTSFEMSISGFKSITARACCEGYPGGSATDQYARLYKYENGNWSLITSQQGAYVNAGWTSGVTNNISKATKLKVELSAKGGNSDAKCTSAIVIDQLI